MSAWERWIFRLLLSVLIGWEAILAGYKLSLFPYQAVDFFQHDFLARFLQQGGRFTDPSWPMQVGSALGLRLPPGLERTAPLLLYLPIVLLLFRALALFPVSTAYTVAMVIQRMGRAWLGFVAMASLLLALSVGLEGVHGFSRLIRLWIGGSAGWLGNNPEYMTNWRTVGTHLGHRILSTLAWVLTFISLGATLGWDLLLWRRPLPPDCPPFAVAVLGTLAAISWHTHPHMLVLLIPLPGVSTRQGRTAGANAIGMNLCTSSRRIDGSPGHPARPEERPRTLSESRRFARRISWPVFEPRYSSLGVSETAK